MVRSAPGKLRVIEGSVLDSDALDAAIDGCSTVYHLAVQCVRRSLGRPIENHKINATGSLTVLEAARRAGVELLRLLLILRSLRQLRRRASG